MTVTVADCALCGWPHPGDPGGGAGCCIWEVNQLASRLLAEVGHAAAWRPVQAGRPGWLSAGAWAQARARLREQARLGAALVLDDSLADDETQDRAAYLHALTCQRPGGRR